MLKKLLCTPLYWIVFAIVLILGRISLLCSLYLFKNPFGSPFVENIHKFLWHSIYVEAGVVLAITTCLIFASLWIRGKGFVVLKIFTVFIGVLYIVTAGIDDEIQRWMFQKFTPSFISCYINAFTDTSIAMDVFSGDAFHFILTVFLVSLFSAAVIIVTYKADLNQMAHKSFKKRQLIVLGVSLLLAIVGCTSFWWFHPLPRRQVRIKPVVYTFISELINTVDARHAPDNYREGVLALGGNPDVEYPFWKEAKNEAESIGLWTMQEFNKRVA